MSEISSDQDESRQVGFEFAIPDGRPGSGLTLMIGPDQGNKSHFIGSLVEATAGESDSGPPRLRTIYMPPLAELADRQPPQETDGAVYRFKTALDPAAKHQLLFDALAEVWDNGNYKKQFDRRLAELLPGFGWSLQQPRSIDSSFDLWSRYWRMPPGFMESGGGLAVFYTLLHLIEAAEETVTVKGQQVTGMLALDRPEEFLLGFSFEKLAGVIGEISQNRQVAVATQAGWLARWPDYINGARVMVFGLDKDGRPKLSQRKAAGVYASVIGPGPRPEPRPDSPPAVDRSQAAVVFEIDERGRTIKSQGEVEKQDDPPWLADETSPEEEAAEKLNLLYQEMLNCDGLIIAESPGLKRAIIQWFDANRTRPGSGAVGCYGPVGEIEIKALLAMAADLGTSQVAAVYADSQSSAKSLAADKAVFSQQFDQKTWLFASLPDVAAAEPDCGKCRDSCQCAPKGISRMFGGKGKPAMAPKTQKALEPAMRQLIQYFD